MLDELNKHFLACSLCKRILKTMRHKRNAKINLFSTLQLVTSKTSSIPKYTVIHTTYCVIR